MHNLSLSFDISAEHFSASALKDCISSKTTYQLTDTLYPVSETFKCFELSIAFFLFYLSVENVVCEMLLLDMSSSRY